MLKWVAMPSSRESSQPRDRTHISHVSCIGRQVLYHLSEESSLVFLGILNDYGHSFSNVHIEATLEVKISRLEGLRASGSAAYFFPVFIFVMRDHVGTVRKDWKFADADNKSQ